MYVDDDDASKWMASSEANNEPAKGTKKLKCGSAIVKKEVVAPHNHKPVAVTVGGCQNSLKI